MIRDFLRTICCFLLLMGVVWADVDTKDGTAITTGTTLDGQTGIDTADGQTITAGGGTDYTADANCQGAWLFASGSTLVDSSGEGNTLVDVGTVTFDADYPTGFTTGQVAVFNGTSQAFYITDALLSANFPAAVQKADFTVAFWVKHDDTAVAEEHVFKKAAGFTFSWVDQVTNYDDFCIRVKDAGATGVTNVVINNAFTSWTHVVFSFDGSENDGTYWISQGSFGSLVNGTTTEWTGVDDTFDADNEYFTIGANQYASGNWFDGKVYQPIIFDRTLSAAEAEEIYTTGITGAD